MKRELHEKEVRTRIIKSARKLFLRNGFDSTTIRQIVKQAGVTTGSIYHFFKNKEEILGIIVGEAFDHSTNQADDIAGDSADAVYRFTLEIGLQFKMVARSRPVAELYRATYRSHRMASLITRKAGERNQRLFGALNPDWSREDFFYRSLAVKGIIQDSVGERLHNPRYSLTRSTPDILRACLQVLGVPPDQITRGLNRGLKALQLEH